MLIRKYVLPVGIFLLGMPFFLTAQPTSTFSPNIYKPQWRQAIAPAILILPATIPLWQPKVQSWHTNLSNSMRESRKSSFHIEDYTQYLPAAALYALELTSLQSEHTIGGKTVLLASSALLQFATTQSLKYSIRAPRPDTGSRNSFPSGHTATAFMGAELLRQQYRDKPWVGITGYVVASSTAFLRVYHNRHWLADVLAGAGIGILSVQVSYWLFPCLVKKNSNRMERNLSITPTTNGVALFMQW